MTFPKYETRTISELRQHYEVEKRLAQQLLGAPAVERHRLYSSVYTELLQSVPLHPHHTRKADPRQSEEEIINKMHLLSRFLKPTTVFLEVGAGNCKLSLRVAELVRKVFALEISKEVVKTVAPAQNLEIVISDGCNVPVPNGSVHVAYSYQVMEHVHPDDAAEQLRNIHRALADGGAYICITPNWVSGPHDVSRYFDSVATGFHLKEYCWTGLAKLFKASGFSEVHGYVGLRNHYFRVPMPLLSLTETLFAMLPGRLRRYVTGLRIISNLLFITVVGIK